MTVDKGGGRLYEWKSGRNVGMGLSEGVSLWVCERAGEYNYESVHGEEWELVVKNV